MSALREKWREVMLAQRERLGIPIRSCDEIVDDWSQTLYRGRPVTADWPTEAVMLSDLERDVRTRIAEAETAADRRGFLRGREEGKRIGFAEGRDAAVRMLCCMQMMRAGEPVSRRLFKRIARQMRKMLP